MTDTVWMGPHEIEVGSPTYDRLVKEGFSEQFSDTAPGDDEQPSLSSLSREELNELATAKGVPGAENLPNKDAVIAAIEAADAEFIAAIEAADAE